MWRYAFNKKLSFILFLEQRLYCVLYEPYLLLSSLLLISYLGYALGLFPLELLDELELSLCLGQPLEAVLFLLIQGHLGLLFLKQLLLEAEQFILCSLELLLHY